MASVGKSSRRGYRIYLIWNAVRFLSVGIIVYMANHDNVKELNEISNDCCNCYFVAKDPSPYNIDRNKRFDLSYCIPRCTDCNYCEAHQDDIPPANWTKCDPLDEYQRHKSFWGLGFWFNPTLPERTGCNEGSDGLPNISLTTITWVEKNYERYGDWSLGIGIVIFLAMLVLARFWNDRAAQIAIIVAIYNAICAEVFLYLLFKPFQYYRKEVSYEGVSIKCEIDSISKTEEDIFTVLIYITFILLGCQIIWVLIQCCCCCKKLCRFDKRDRIDSYHKLTDATGFVKRCRCTCRGCDCMVDWGYYLFYGHVAMGIFVLLMIIFFAGVVIWALYVMIKARHLAEDVDTTKQVYIWVTNGLLFFSLWDIIIFPFCRNETAKFIWDGFKTKMTEISRSRRTTENLDDLISVHGIDESSVRKSRDQSMQ